VGELQDVRWDIICFNETRAKQDDVILDGGHRLISGPNDASHLGAAILLHAQYSDNVSRIHNCSDRLVAIDVTLHGAQYRIISAYAPHSGYGHQALIDFYTDIRNLMVPGKILSSEAILIPSSM